MAEGFQMRMIALTLKQKTWSISKAAADGKAWGDNSLQPYALQLPWLL